MQSELCRPDNLSIQEKVKAHGAVFSVQAVFALWYIVGHIVLRDNDPLSFALVRELLSASALVVLAERFEGKIKVQNARDVGDIILLVSSQPCTVLCVLQPSRRQLSTSQQLLFPQGAQSGHFSPQCLVCPG